MALLSEAELYLSRYLDRSGSVGDDDIVDTDSAFRDLATCFALGRDEAEADQRIDHGDAAADRQGGKRAAGAALDGRIGGRP